MMKILLHLQMLYLDHVEALVDDNPDMKSDSTRSVSKSWIKSAQGNRTAILNRI